ncbi:MAG: plastocyanin/azurin family copper-binding protein [Halobacteriales archaeon]
MSPLSRREFLKKGNLPALSLIVGLSGCSSAPTAEATETTGSGSPAKTVSVGPGQDFVFEPGTEEALTISAGTNVVFEWKSDGHNIVVGSQPDNANWEGTPGNTSELYDTGYTHEHTFDVPGDYHYWCEPHKSLGMEADIVVEA